MFTHCPVGEHLGCVQFEAVIGDAATKGVYEVFATSGGRCVFEFLRNCRAVFQVAILFSFPTSRVWGFQSLHPCQCVVLSVFYFSHSSGCVVSSYCDRSLESPKDIEHLYMYSFAIYVCSLGK